MEWSVKKESSKFFWLAKHKKETKNVMKRKEKEDSLEYFNKNLFINGIPDIVEFLILIDSP